MRNVLLVEDNVNHRQLIKKHLSEMGFEVFASGTDKDGMDLFQNNKIDFALLDISLRGDQDYDGIWLAQKIYKERNIPIMYLTARGEEHFQAALQFTGFAEWNEKLNETDIYNPSSFSRRIRKFLNDVRIGRYDIYNKNEGLVHLNGHIIRLNEIGYLEYESKNYVDAYLHTIEKPIKIVVRGALSDFDIDGKFHMPFFHRINRNIVINQNCIEKIKRGGRPYENHPHQLTLTIKGKSILFKISGDHFKRIAQLPYFDSQIEK